MKRLSCDEADFLRGTEVFAGTITRVEAEALRRHATECERSDWHHALGHSLWGLVERDRGRRA